MTIHVKFDPILGKLRENDADGVGAISSVFGRIGVIVATSGDYSADQIVYDNSGSSLSATDVKSALEELDERILLQDEHNELQGIQGGDDTDTIPEYYHLSEYYYTEVIDLINDNNSGGTIISDISTIVGAGDSPDELADGSISVYFLDGSSDTCILNLEASPVTGQLYNIKCIDSTNIVTVSGNGKNIDNAASMMLIKDESITIIYDGTQWRII